MLEEFTDFLKEGRKYGNWVMIKDLIGINHLYLQSHYINKILDFAEENEYKFTFFMTAKNLEKKKKAINRLLDSGHEIASHSYNHVALGKKSYNRIIKEFSLARKEFKNRGIETLGFRAPFLSVSKDTVRAMGEFNFKYSSNVEGGKMFEYENKVKEIPIIDPYDWKAFVVYGMTFNQLLEKWKGQEGVFLLHPWIITKYLNKFRGFALKQKKDFRIKSNLKKGGVSVSFDVY